DAILEMTAKRMGLTGVFEGRRLVGIITDGDLRRALERSNPRFNHSGAGAILDKRAADVMTKNPKTIGSASLAEAALKKMEEHSITSLFVHDDDSKEVVGVVHLHDLIKAGVI
ncbi:MAG: CBS domain-containing protein, partial [Deltaproteobacteria bacterium]|nr:CBS domain-containing protein [Deltaproteobacteria bacterium]